MTKSTPASLVQAPPCPRAVGRLLAHRGHPGCDRVRDDKPGWKPPEQRCLGSCTCADGRVKMAHPLDMLTADEVTRAVDVLRATGCVGGGALCAHVVRCEPAKEELARWRSGDSIDREVRALIVPGPGLTLI